MIFQISKYFDLFFLGGGGGGGIYFKENVHSKGIVHPKMKIVSVTHLRRPFDFHYGQKARRFTRRIFVFGTT